MTFVTNTVIIGERTLLSVAHFNYNNSMNPKELKERLFKDIDVNQLPERLREEIMQKLIYLTMKKLIQEIVKKIPENRLEEFTMVSESGNPQRTQEFLSKFIHNLDALTEDIIRTEVETFKKVHNIS
jgi:hypothetical protein